MRENDPFTRQVEEFLVEFDGATPLPGRVTDAIRAELPRIQQAKAGRGFLRLTTISTHVPWGIGAATRLGLTAVVIVALGVVGLTVLRQAGVGPAASPSPTATLETTIPVACSNTDLPGTLLGCSMDGTRLLVQQGLEGTLFVLDTDGSETQVSEPLPPLDGNGMSARPSGATISPDGSRVVFAGVTKSGALNCHNGALFAVNADGGPAEVLWRSQAAGDGGIVRYPTFSPDGTQIAFADGYCDWNHSVWVMNADGSGAHQILDIGPTMGAGYVRGLAWSPVGDRIALQYQGWDDGFNGLRTYTFATDGSGLTQGGDASEFCWPRLRCPVLPGPVVGPAASPSPTAELGTSESVASPIACGHQSGVLGCSSDGTRQLIQEADGNLVVVHADGSETQVAEQLSRLDGYGGNGLPSGATISPDGSRVVFPGVTTRAGGYCHNGALFAVDADGGPAELLWKSQAAAASPGIRRSPPTGRRSRSPTGTATPTTACG